MKIRLIAFSATGCRTAEKIAVFLEKNGCSCQLFSAERFRTSDLVVPLDQSLHEWTKESFCNADALIFCCACGIAIRGISPFVRSKTTDPAVIVVDETGKFAIPVLSGHIGGANELASLISDGIGSIPVITTATDLHGLFAVDVFASKNNLYITDLTLAKEISAALLAGKTIGIASELPLPCAMPAGLSGAADSELGIWISNKPEAAPFPKALTLFPRIYSVGIGCRKNKPLHEIETFFLQTLAEWHIDVREIRAIASIDIKRDEPGILGLCEKYNLPFLVYSAQQLNEADGDFTKSDFVKQTVGVDCVCERSAVCAGGHLLYSKRAGNGVTLAIGVYKEDIYFE